METLSSDQSLPSLLESLQARENSFLYEGYPKDDLNIPGNMLIINSSGSMLSFRKVDIVESEQLPGGQVKVWIRRGSKAFYIQSLDTVSTTAALPTTAAKTGFVMDVAYTENGVEHLFLLDINCVNGTWRSFDGRLITILSGSHRPPGIETPFGITGTVFALSNSTDVCFALRDFLATPFFPSKYPIGHKGTGLFVKPPSAYSTADKDLRWVVSDPDKFDLIKFLGLGP